MSAACSGLHQRLLVVRRAAQVGVLDRHDLRQGLGFERKRDLVEAVFKMALTLR